MPKAILPTVSHETAVMTMCDLIREEMLAGETDDAGGPLTDAVLAIAQENPEILASVVSMMRDNGESERIAALVGMAITYRALKAQAETEALEKMAGL